MPEPLVIDRASGVPIHLQIRNHLKEQIASGALEEGTRLPPLKALARRYGIAYATMQRIVKDLEREGLVGSVRGRGVFVRKHMSGDDRRPGELRVSALEPTFGPDESAYLQNEFQKRVPGGRLVLSADSPDLLHLYADDVAALAEELVDVSDLIEDVYHRPGDEPDMFGRLMVDGRHPMMPVDMNTPVMVINVDLFENRGIPLPSRDWTWDDWLRIARELTSRADGVYGFYPGGEDYFFQVMVWQKGGRLFSRDGESCLLDADEAIESARTIRRLNAFAPPGLKAEDLRERPMISAFASGRIGMIQHNRWFPETFRRTGSRVRWAVRPVPRGGEPVALLHARGFGLRKDSPVQDAAREFLKAAASWEKWPQKVGHWYGFRLHADLERNDETEAVFKAMISCGRTPLSDILPERRTKRHREALVLMRSALCRVVLTDHPVGDIMHHAAHTINALLNIHKEEDAMRMPRSPIIV